MRISCCAGFIAKKCNRLTVKRKGHSWICQVCGCEEKHALINTLIDYALLVDSKITNGRLREFVGISSVHMASKILKSLDLPYNGDRKHRKYELQFDYLQKQLGR